MASDMIALETIGRNVISNGINEQQTAVIHDIDDEVDRPTDASFCNWHYYYYYYYYY